MADFEHARALLRMAHKDFNALTGMLDNALFADEIFGFHVQQAIEKGLKAWLCACGIAYPAPLLKKPNPKEFCMANLSNSKRNPLMADTEPTDEELSEVMSEARDSAMARKRESDDWMRRKLAEAVSEARARDAAPAS